MLKVKEIFGPTIQGEGDTAGSPAIFVRFSGCNMWSGRDEDKEKSMCPFCDTNFYGGEELTPVQIFNEVKRLMNGKQLLVVLTGGEPLLQKKISLLYLIELLEDAGYYIQIESNGTVSADDVTVNIDHLTVSPKLPLSKCKVNFNHVSCLKLLYPHPNKSVIPEDFIGVIGSEANRKYYLQPIYDIDRKTTITNVQKTIKKVKELGHPWRLSIQTHKLINQP